MQSFLNFQSFNHEQLSMYKLSYIVGLRYNKIKATLIDKYAMAALLWQLCYGSFAMAALLWQLCYGSFATTALLRQLCNGSYARATMLR